MRKCKFDSLTINTSGQCVILTQLIKSIKQSQVTEVEIDLVTLAKFLSDLNPRMTKTIMDIVVEYNHSNPEVIQIMGRANGAPYGGLYDSEHNHTSMDLKKFPDGLVIVLYEFVKLVQIHAK